MNNSDSHTTSVHSNFTKLIYSFFYEGDLKELKKTVADYKTRSNTTGDEQEIPVWEEVVSPEELKKAVPTEGLYPYIDDLFEISEKVSANDSAPKSNLRQSGIFILNKTILNKIFLDPICVLSRDAKKISAEWPQDPGNESYPFKVKDVMLLLPAAGIGLLIFHVELRGKTLPVESLLGFNYGIRILSPRRGLSYKRKAPPTTIKLPRYDNDKNTGFQGWVENQRNFRAHHLFDLIDLLLMPVKKRGIGKWENTFDRNLNVFSFARIDDRKSLDDIFFSFSMFQKARNITPVSPQKTADYLTPVKNSNFSVNQDGGAVMTCGKSDYSIQRMKYEISATYFTIYIICLIQKNILLKFSDEIADLFSELSPGIISDRKHLRALSRLNRKFLEFESRVWFTQISNVTMKQNYYHYARDRMGSTMLFEEVKSNINELYTYIKGRMDHTMNGFLAVITIFFFPVTILAGIFGMNIQEISDLSPFFNTLLLRPFGWISISLIFIYLLFIIIMLTRRDN